MPKQPAVPIIGSPNLPIRFTLEMTSGKKTWSEIHWYSGPTSITDAQLQKNAQAVAVARQGMLATGCTVTDWILSQENVFGDSAHAPPTIWVPNAAYGAVEETNDALPLYMQASTQYRRTMYISGVPDVAIVGDAWVQKQPPGWLAAMVAYFQLLTGQNPFAVPGAPPPGTNNIWGYLPLLAPTTVPGQPTVNPVVNISVGGFAFTSLSTQFTVTTDQNHGATVGDVVQISKVQGVNQQFPMNQRWIVNAVPAVNVITLQGFPPSVIPASLPISGGFLQRRQRAFVAYTSWAVGDPTNRKRGRSLLGQKAKNKRKYNIGSPG